MKVSNRQVNIEARVRTVDTMLAIAPQQSSALSLYNIGPLA